MVYLLEHSPNLNPPKFPSGHDGMTLIHSNLHSDNLHCHISDNGRVKQRKRKKNHQVTGIKAENHIEKYRIEICKEEADRKVILVQDGSRRN